MAQNGRPINRAYSPYAVDSLEDLSKEPNSFSGGYQNGAYSNLGLRQSRENISRNPSTFKGGYQNPSYENSEAAHQYEDPSHLTIPPPSTGPRRKRNEMYEPTEIQQTKQEAENDDFSEYTVGDSWLSRLILFLILMISLVSLLLVVMITLGKLGPGCSACSEEQQGMILSNCHSKVYLTVFCYFTLYVQCNACRRVWF